jgi:hypothetical protein
MRYQKTWWWPIAVVACATLFMASLEYFLFHQPFVHGLIKGAAILGGIFLALRLFRYRDPPKQPQPQTTAEPQPPKAEEQDASGG